MPLAVPPTIVKAPPGVPTFVTAVEGAVKVNAPAVAPVAVLLTVTVASFCVVLAVVVVKAGTGAEIVSVAPVVVPLSASTSAIAGNAPAAAMFTVSVAPFAPSESSLGGTNCSTIVQNVPGVATAPTARMLPAPHVEPAAAGNSVALVPVTDEEAMPMIGTLPVFCTVKICVVAGVPRTTLPKLPGAGVSVAERTAVTPVPVNDTVPTVTGLPKMTPVTVNVPDWVPVAVGAKTTPIVQVPPFGFTGVAAVPTEPPQVPGVAVERANCAGNVAAML